MRNPKPLRDVLLKTLICDGEFGPIKIGHPIIDPEVVQRSTGCVRLHPGTDLLRFGALQATLYDGVVEYLQLDFLGSAIAIRRPPLPRLVVPKAMLSVKSITMFLDSNHIRWWKDNTLSFGANITLITETGAEIAFNEHLMLFHIIVCRDIKLYAQKRHY